MFNLMRRAHELTNQSPSLSGLCDAQIVPQPYGLDDLDKFGVGSTKSTLYFDWENAQ